ncbi:hypothetical protein I5U30_05100 [Stenotrophomonas maltophilia]|nr:hypothetical protein [Stenotrophomonas maltophilia]MCU1115486.1 hypothetical protein [Stenotrophomonas maltophilia]
MELKNNLRRIGASVPAKVSAGVATLMASGAALASGGSSPGAAIATAISGGDADMKLIIGACAVLLGILVVWAYTKRAAK